MKRKRIFGERTYSDQGRIRTLVCQDCGQTLETSESPSRALCPNCGGKRMNIKIFTEPAPRKSVFENHDTELEGKLKTFSGSRLTEEEFQKEFTDANAAEVFQKCYATEDESGMVTIRPDAYDIEKAFSKLIISVTKELDLDPTIMSGLRPIPSVVGGLHMPPKAIIAIKKAHNIEELPGEHKEEDNSKEWIADSGIVGDLKEEFGGDTMGLDEFIKIIRERYPDAPRNIYDILEDRGAISLDGTKVNILH